MQRPEAAPLGTRISVLRAQPSEFPGSRPDGPWRRPGVPRGHQSHPGMGL